MLKIQSDRVIIDGHEPTKEQCETMTLLANALAESNNFKIVEYRDGYAEFEKVGKAEKLKFAEEGTEIVVNSTTLETTLHTAGKYCDKNILVKSSDSNLIAENIKKDVSVFGVTGSYAGSGGRAIEVATETEMANILSSATADDNGKIYRYTGTTGTYVNGALYYLEVQE